MVSAAAFCIKREKKAVLNAVNCVDHRLHCIVKLMMHTCEENVMQGFMEQIFWPLGTLGAFCATHVRTLRKDISLDNH